MQPEVIIGAAVVGVAFIPHGVRAWLRRRARQDIDPLFDTLAREWQLESRVLSPFVSRTRVLTGDYEGRPLTISHHVHAGFVSGFLPWGIMRHIIVETPNRGGMTAGPTQARAWVFFSQSRGIFVQGHAKFVRTMGAVAGKEGVALCPGVHVSRDAATAKPDEAELALLGRTIGRARGVITNDSASVWTRLDTDGAATVDSIRALLADAHALAELSESR